MGRASNRKKFVQPEGYLGGLLDDLFVVMPFAELGYTRYQMMLQSLPDYGWLILNGKIISQQGAYPDQAAQGLAMEALKIPGWKRLLFLEHDHEYPASIFRRHAAYTEPIVAGLYTLRDIENPLPVCYMWDEERGNAVIPNAEKINQLIAHPALYPMDAVPLGCTSIAREVFEGWPKDKPFFTAGTNSRGARMSHDMWFCRIAQEAGFQPYIDSRLLVSHFALVPIDISYFVRWWNSVGADKAQKDGLRQALRIVPPSNGTKLPKIAVAHTASGLLEATKEAVEATGLGVLYDKVQADNDYYMMVAGLWAQGETFVTCEQDIVPAPGQIEELLACPEPWCAYEYDYPPFGNYAGMGLAKFSDQLIARMPDAMKETGKWHDPSHPPMHWCRVDGWLKQYLTENLAVQHLHGQVEHRHKGRPAHDCATVSDAAPTKSRFARVTA